MGRFLEQAGGADADVHSPSDELVRRGAIGRLHIDEPLSTAVVRTEDGVAVELTVEVTTDGAVLLHTGEYTERADTTLAAVRAFVGLLAQAEAAARG